MKKKLAKKQVGGTAESMKPYPKRTKFDPSKVSTSGAKIKGAEKMSGKTYKPSSILYKKAGGAVTGKKISVAKSPRPSTAGTGSAGKYVTPKKAGAFDKYKAKKK